jgi:Protein of unknown function (DUF2863)
MMKSSRAARTLRDRKSHLSPDAERLVSAALGLANSGSRPEDRFWEQQLSGAIERLLDGGHLQTVNDALDRLSQTDSEAYGALIESLESVSELFRIEIGGVEHDALLITAPVVAWTRFEIGGGATGAEPAAALGAHWQAHVLAREVKFRMLPYLYSLDQLPRDFAEVRRFTRRLAQSVASGNAPRIDLKNLPQTAHMLADTRFLVAIVAAPVGKPMFRWQELDSREHGTRVTCLEQWIAQGRASIEPLLPGCGFECLLPDAYHINLRESDRRVRPYAIRAAVHYLTHAYSVAADALKASIGAFGGERIDEYRIGLSVGDSDEVAQGVVWPLLGSESEDDEPAPLERIREALREVGVTEIRVWTDAAEPEFCEDCGAPLFPNPKGEVAHAEGPEDGETQQPGHFH